MQKNARKIMKYSLKLTEVVPELKLRLAKM